MNDSQAGAALSAVGVLSPLALRAPLRRLHLTGLLKRASRSTPAHTARNRDFSQTRTSGIMMHPCGLSRLHPVMKRRTNTERPRPKLPRITGRQFAADVRHDGRLPREWPSLACCRARVPWIRHSPSVKKQLQVDSRILPSTRDAKWFWCQILSDRLQVSNQNFSRRNCHGSVRESG